MQFMASKNSVLYDEIRQNIIYIIPLYPQDHPIRKLLLLTTRELQCLCLLLKGYSSKQAGTLLGVSYRTVEIHFGNIKEKLALTMKIEVFDWFWNILSQL